MRVGGGGGLCGWYICDDKVDIKGRREGGDLIEH